MAKQTDPHRVLEAVIQRYGTAQKAAAALGVSGPYLSDIRKGRRDFSAAMLAKLGLERVIVEATKS